MKNMKKHVEMLGFKAKDKVTGTEGVITSVSFDLYGCIQVVLNMGYSNDTGTLTLNHGWFDVSRIKIISKKRVMDIPNYDYGLIAEGKKGACEKP